MLNRLNRLFSSAAIPNVPPTQAAQEEESRQSSGGAPASSIPVELTHSVGSIGQQQFQRSLAPEAAEASVRPSANPANETWWPECKALHREMMDKIAVAMGKDHDTEFKAYLWRPSDLERIIYTTSPAQEIVMAMRSPIYDEAGQIIGGAIDGDGERITEDQFRQEFQLDLLDQRKAAVFGLIATYQERFRTLAQEHGTTAPVLYLAINQVAIAEHGYPNEMI